MRTLRVLVLVSMVLVSALSGRAEDSFNVESVLSSLTSSTVKEPLVIEFELVATTSPFKGPKEELDRKVADLQKSVEQTLANADQSSKEGGERMVKSYRQSLEQKGRSVTRHTLVLMPKFSALRTLDRDPYGQICHNWEVRKGDLYYSLYMPNDHVTILNKKEWRRYDKIELALEAVGLLGKLPEEMVKKALAEPQVTRSDSTIRIASGPEEVVLESQADGSYRVKSFGHHYEKVGQSKSTTFSEYRTFGSTHIPSVVKDEFSNNEYDISRVYSVLDVHSKLDELLIPFINAEFGYVTVTDARFSPQLTYEAVSSLPSDKQVEEWRANPAALQKHNNALNIEKRKRR